MIFISYVFIRVRKLLGNVKVYEVKVINLFKFVSLKLLIDNFVFWKLCINYGEGVVLIKKIDMIK